MTSAYKLTVLGCGTSTGVPVVCCPCAICQSDHPRNQRLRASVWVEGFGKSILIDTSTDLRQQALRAGIKRVDAVFYTHPHADHVLGIDELRSFNFFQKDRIPLYGHDWTVEALRRQFPYIFDPGPVEGGGIPLLDIREIASDAEYLEVGDFKAEIIRVEHGSMQVLAYRFDSIAYLTDCSYIPPESMKKLEDLDVLLLDCVRLKPHRTHLNLESALNVVEELRPKKTYLTHLGHDFDYPEWQKKLPDHVELSYDGLVINP